MPPTKTQAEPQSKAGPTPTTDKLPESPEKKAGLIQATLVQQATSALPTPNGKPPAARAGDVLAAPPTSPGAPGRARMLAAIQRSVGNACINRMLATNQTAPVPSTTSISVQRSLETPWLIQRKCACGGEAGPDGECAACKTEHMAVQCQANAPTAPDALLPPTGRPSAARVADLMTGSAPGVATVRRAQMAAGMQQAVGATPPPDSRTLEKR